MLVSTDSRNHNGGSRCLRRLIVFVSTLSVLSFGRCAANLHNVQGTDQSIAFESRALGIAPATFHNPMLTTRNAQPDTVALSTRSSNKTVPRPQVLNAYAMLIPSRAHADLFRKAILEIRDAAIKAVEPAIAPMKFTFAFGTIVFTIWLLALKPGIADMLAELFDAVWMATHPISLFAVELVYIGCVAMWIKLGGQLHPVLLDRRNENNFELI